MNILEKKLIEKKHKLTSIEQELIVLLDKKYNNKRLEYNDNSFYYLNGINREILETQINFKNKDFDYPYKNDISIYNTNKINSINTYQNIIDTYLGIDGFLCYYDIDILNLVMKHIIINRQLPEKIITEETNNSWIYNYFFSLEPKKFDIKKNLNYFINTYSNIGIEKKTISKFFYIVKEIIIPFSTYELI